MKDNRNYIVDSFDKKNNSVTLLSIICSILIIGFHCYPLFYGAEAISPLTKLFKTINTGELVVDIFFIISGFMIAKSIKNSNNIGEFLFKRVKKIYPGLLLVILFSVFVIAPIVSSDKFLVFLSKPQYYYRYIIDNLLLYKNTTYSIETVFANNIYPYAINGSLWSIKHTFFSYLFIIPIYLILLKNIDSSRKKKIVFVAFFFVIAIIYYLAEYDYINEILYRMSKYGGKYIGVLSESKQFFRLLYYFMTGILLEIFSKKIKFDKRVFFLFIILVLLFIRTNYSRIVLMFTFPYIIVMICCFKSRIKQRDISYYIYLFAFPIQQTIYYFMNKHINIYMFIILSIIITVITSIAADKLVAYIRRINSNKKIDEDRKTSFDILKIICLFSIIVISTSSLLGINSKGWNFVQFFVRPSFGILLVLIGYYSVKEKTDSIIKFWKQKIFDIVLPLLIYMFIYYLIYYSVMPGKNILRFVYNDSIGFTWFIFSIIEIYILMPLIIRMLKNLNQKQIKIVLILFLIVSIIMNLINHNKIFIGFSFNIITNSSLFYFILGYYLYNYKININKRMTLMYLLGIIIYVIDLKIKWLPVDYKFSLFIVFSILFYISVIESLDKKILFNGRFKKVLAYISKRILGMYIIHYLIYKIISEYGLLAISTKGLVKSLISIAYESLIIFAISLFVSILVDKVIIMIIKDLYIKIYGIISKGKRRIKA